MLSGAELREKNLEKREDYSLNDIEELNCLLMPGGAGAQKKRALNLIRI